MKAALLIRKETLQREPSEKGGVLSSSSFLHYLLKCQILSRDQGHILLIEKEKNGASLEQLILSLGFLREEELFGYLTHHSGIPLLDQLATTRDESLSQQVPLGIMEKFQVLPYQMTPQGLEVAMIDPYDIEAMDSIQPFFPQETRLLPRLCRPSEWSMVMTEEALKDRLAQASGQEEGYPSNLDEKEEDFSSFMRGEGGGTPFEKGFSPAQFIEALIFQALKKEASDIHFSPHPHFVEILIRVDGVLQSLKLLPSHLWRLVCGFLKILAGMNIADSRHPQSGRFPMNFGHRHMDCRASIHPTKEGENFVVRLLDQSMPLRALSELGYMPQTEALMEKALQRPAGLIIVAGPTGAGKTTTLYAMVQALKRGHLNIMTLEDPIEYTIPHVRQSQVGETGVLTFGEGVRSLLRQDPDVLVVGEIRDAETAQMALRAAMTGHPVLTTLHGMDVRGAIHRLVDLGVSVSSLSGHVTAIVAQRLVRRLCLCCRRQVRLSPQMGEALGLENTDEVFLFEAVGCQACGHTGYKGRLAIAEGLLVTKEMDLLLTAGLPLFSDTQKGSAFGFLSLAVMARAHILKGDTSVEEVIRHIDLTELASPVSKKEKISLKRKRRNEFLTASQGIKNLESSSYGIPFEERELYDSL
jgi:general secretion pathway protein E/type IV pilus assembly protein PilB